MKIRSLLTHMLLLHSTITSAKPVVSTELPGLLGNRLFGFCVARIIAEELGYDFYCQPIWGFPNTYLYMENRPSNQYPTERFVMGSNNVGAHDIDIQSIVNNHSERNIFVHGYFQRYKYIKSYAKKIRQDWLKLDPSLTYKQDPNDIVLHIRTNNGPVFLPFEYYEKALSMTSYNRLYICIDEPNDSFLNNFKKYNPIVCSTRSLSQLMNANLSWGEISKINVDDFAFICSFNKIILSHSTYSWWAGFLSEAEEIYAPYDPQERHHTYGKVEEDRYHYIETVIGRG